MENQIFNYNGNNITFQTGNGDVMVNATEMAKAFNKMPKDYLKTQSAQEFINALTKRKKCLLTDLVIVTHGGDDRETWMHEDVALDFAQWLSVDFKIWCNERIKEILQKHLRLTEQQLQIAKELGLSVEELNKKVEDIVASYKPSTQCFLTGRFYNEEDTDIHITLISSK